MRQTKHSSSRQIVCWSLAILFGVLVSIIVSAPLPVLFAVILGVGLAAAAGIVMQRQICGLGLDDWGPFQGLKGVPGWDDDEPDDVPGMGLATPAARKHVSDGAPQADMVQTELAAGQAAETTAKGKVRAKPAQEQPTPS